MIRLAAVRGVFALALAVAPSVWAQQPPANEDGYDLWLRYRRVTDAARLAEYRASASQLVVSGGTPTINAARSELAKGIEGLLGKTLPVARALTRDGAIVIGTPATSPLIARLPLAAEVRTLARDGFLIRAVTIAGHKATVIAGNRDIGVLYGVFRFLRELQTNRPVASIAIVLLVVAVVVYTLSERKLRGRVRGRRSPACHGEHDREGHHEAILHSVGL